MQRMIFFCLLISNVFTQLTITTANLSQCSCKNAKAQEDCLTQYCNWDSTTSTCTNKSCSTFLTNDDCQGLPDPFKCAWSEATNSCVTFTKCSDFSYNITQAYSECADLEMCQEDYESSDSTTGKRKCMNKSINAIRSTNDCAKVDYNNCYWIIQADGKQCYQNIQTQKCETQTITKCQDYSKDNCNPYACYPDSAGVCTPLTCSYYKTQTNLQSLTLCKWVNNSCIDMDPKTLTRTQCMTSTLYSYIWNPSANQCQLCETKSTPIQVSSTIILQGILIFLFILD